MAQRLKRWESPRREGRNDKGKSGTARQRQKRKQLQALRQRLKNQANQSESNGGSANASPIFCAIDSGAIDPGI
ncbi:MAG TPA: hypothetical protein V6D18_11550 [Thermosynechococcaceae cyanobacterium]